MEFEGRSRIRDQLSITPLIDVVFLLLVFFLLTSTILQPEAVELTLPSSESAEAIADLPIEVALGRDGTVALNGEQIALAQLEPALADLLRIDSEKTVSLKSDKTASVQAVLEVIDRIRAAGGRNLALATAPDG